MPLSARPFRNQAICVDQPKTLDEKSATNLSTHAQGIWAGVKKDDRRTSCRLAAGASGEHVFDSEQSRQPNGRPAGAGSGSVREAIACARIGSAAAGAWCSVFGRSEEDND